MSDTITKINDTIDLLQDDVLRAVETIGDTVDNANDLITAVRDDVKTMASAGAVITQNARDISDAIRSGRGTVGKLVNDDELYRRASSIARSVDEIAKDARQVVEHTGQVVEQARQALANLQGKNGPVQGLTSDLRQTMEEARVAMSGFAENMDALKRNFLFRGFFNDRGYFNLSDISPAEYRKGLLTKKGARTVARVWLTSAVLFERDSDNPEVERLREDAKPRLDSAIAPYLERLGSGVLVVEGYSQQGTTDEQYLRSRSRAVIIRDYLVGKFHLDPQSTGVMPLGSDVDGSPPNRAWDGVAIAAFLNRANK
jgi:phospholipid/cholesterol/gamma-HCH transport system substrate-binding protein